MPWVLWKKGQNEGDGAGRGQVVPIYEWEVEGSSRVALEGGGGTTSVRGRRERRRDGRTESKMAVRRHPRGSGRTMISCIKSSTGIGGRSEQEESRGQAGSRRRTDHSLLLEVEGVYCLQKQSQLGKNTLQLEKQTHFVKPIVLCHKTVSGAPRRRSEKSASPRPHRDLPFDLHVPSSGKRENREVERLERASA